MLIEERKDLIQWYFEVKKDSNVKNKIKFVCEKFFLKYQKPIHEKSVAYNLKKWKKFGNLETRQKGIEHKKTVLTPINIEKVKNNLSQFPSVNKLSNKTKIKRESVRRILRNELKMFPYKVQIGQSLTKFSELKS
jgi:hypothetical protein